MAAEPFPGRRSSTGISGLDEIIGGGLRAGRWYVVQGGPGTGKTTLGFHFLQEGVRAGERVLCITLEKDESVVRSDIRSIGIDLEGIEVLDLSPDPEFFSEEATYDIFSPAEVERRPTTRRIMDAVERLRPDRVFVDSITMFRYLTADDLHFRRQLLSFMKYLTNSGATVLVSAEADPALPNADLQFLSSGVITLRHTWKHRSDFRTLNVDKLLGSDFRGGIHSMQLGRDGIEVFPRLLPEAHGKAFRPETVSSGVPGLDELLGGGIERGLVSLIVGPSGSGKTTVAFQFMAEVAVRGERAVVFSFEENAETVLERAERIGLPARKAVADGTLSIIPVEPLRVTADQFASWVRREVEEKNASFVLVDSISGYEMTLLGPELTPQLFALSRYLRNMGVTTLLTRETERVTGDFRLTEIGISFMADNIIFLRYIEMGGHLRKAIGVLKKRVTNFERTLREMEITSEGIRVGRPLAELRGILSGIPHRIDERPGEAET